MIKLLLSYGVEIWCKNSAKNWHKIDTKNWHKNDTKIDTKSWFLTGRKSRGGSNVGSRGGKDILPIGSIPKWLNGSNSTTKHQNFPRVFPSIFECFLGESDFGMEK